MSGQSCSKNDINKKYNDSLKCNETNSQNHDENICRHKTEENKSIIGDTIDNTEKEKKKYTQENEIADNTCIDENKNNVLHASKIQNMMKKMGYKPGKGLGKNDQGRVEPIETVIQRGRKGLGHYIHKAKRKKSNSGDAIDNIKEENNIQEIETANNACIDEKSNMLHTLKIQNMMKKMGYKPGKGLGKNDQGRVEPVEAITPHGRRGLGFITSQISKKKVAIIKKAPISPSSFLSSPPLKN
ncbi:tuftelin-interacting protein 11-like [Cataglyphis hispanica]|uniref:tuftelin-interacting protein 11-like n=1 Tax=Cataglyphis hispanica TaxID=1086592 RepID=UPI00217FECDD|nr:tuftelin-interacting protein 11-like [Cataglyphis hispanica]